MKLDPLEIEVMARCWGEFWKTILGPQQLREDAMHPKGCTMLTCQHTWDDRCKTKWQEMWQWEDYVLRHYRAPQISGRNLEQSIGLVLVLLGFWK